MPKLRSKASRTRPCPNELRVFIEFVNSVLPSENLDFAREADGEDMESRFRSHIQSFEYDEFRRFRRYIGPVDPENIDLLGSFARYQLLRLAREVLRLIATFGATQDTVNEVSLQLGASGLVGTLDLEIDEQGRFRFDQGLLVKALDGVEATRIRQCPICGYIFWAGRKDQVCWPTSCAKILRTHRWREKYPEYKHRRYLAEERRKRNGLDVARPAI